MADFADVVAEIKNTNKKLDTLAAATDPKGAAAAEDKKEKEQAAAAGYCLHCGSAGLKTTNPSPCPEQDAPWQSDHPVH